MWKFPFMFYECAGLLARNEKLAEPEKFVREEIIEILTRLFRQFRQTPASSGPMTTKSILWWSIYWMLSEFWFAFQQTITRKTRSPKPANAVCVEFRRCCAHTLPRLFQTCSARSKSAFRSAQSDWDH